VSAGWRPYYDGYWASYRPYGWTWIGGGVWGWPTHHYGRWGFARSRWFWIPDRRWGPAWVSWAGAPGYVSWCPLGFDNRPVFGLSVNIGNPWAGWVVMHRTHFGGRGYYANRYAVAPHRLPRSTPFVLHAEAPIAPRAVPRRASGDAAAFAVPRNGAGGIAIPRRGAQSPSAPSYVIRGNESQDRGTAPRAEARRPDNPRSIPGPSANEPSAESPRMSRERTFREPLPQVRRAVPRAPAAADAGGATPGGSGAVIDRRRDARGDVTFGRVPDAGASRSAVPRWGSPGAERPSRAISPSAPAQPVPQVPPQYTPRDRAGRPDTARTPMSREAAPRVSAPGGTPGGPSRAAPMAVPHATPRSSAPAGAPPARSRGEASGGGGQRSSGEGSGGGQRSSGAAGGGGRQAPSRARSR
jgi:hypothetical protein